MNVSPVRRAEPQEERPRVKVEARKEPEVEPRQEAQEAQEESTDKKLIAKA